MKLTAKARRAIPTKDFALPGKRKDPINNKSHARAALTMGMRGASPAEKKEIRTAVHRKFPDVGKGATMKKTMKKEMKKSGGKSGMKKKSMKVMAHKAIGAQKGYTL